MPNPQGVNNFDRFGAEAAYGAVQRATKLAQAAPMAGAPVSPLNAPRRAQRRAVRGQAAQAAPPMAATPAEAPQLPYPLALAQEWAELAREPGISPLVQEVAAEARRASP